MLSLTISTRQNKHHRVIHGKTFKIWYYRRMQVMLSLKNSKNLIQNSSPDMNKMTMICKPKNKFSTETYWRHKSQTKEIRLFTAHAKFYFSTSHKTMSKFWKNFVEDLHFLFRNGFCLFAEVHILKIHLTDVFSLW